MSIEVDWAAATSGPDGEALAERIRSFVHDKFQQVPLPRFIRSVQVHSFDFGTIAPDLEIKDFGEPFTDFYEEDEDDDTSASHSSYDDELQFNHTASSPHSHSLSHHPYPGEEFQPSVLRSPLSLGDHLNPHFLPRAGTPGIPGGTSTLGYHLMSLGGLSGSQTPLAAVAGSNLPTSRLRPGPDPELDTTTSASRPSTANTHPSHPSIAHTGSSGSNQNTTDPADFPQPSTEPATDPSAQIQRRPEDFQILCHAKYAGDVRMSLTAEILLDYPMPSFAGLPLKLNVTGITFDGVAVVAYIRKRIHFCFLSPEDTDTLLGSEAQTRQGGLLQEIRVESEIGRNEEGKQGLKNVDKVERFVLAQVRRIFEEELVFPSFWTFLI